MNNSMKYFSYDKYYTNMLSSFGFNELQTLLGAFGQNKRGRISELKDRAIEILRTRPANIHFPAYRAKINEIYRSLQHGMLSNDIMMRNSLQNQQQQQQRQMRLSMGHIQSRPQRMYRSPQYPRQSIHMARAGLRQVMPIMQRGLIQNRPQRMYRPPQYPRRTMHVARAGLRQVMPKMQRGMYGNHNILNSIPANSVVNNNIQYIAAGNYQPSGNCTIVSRQLPPKEQLKIVAQDALELGTTTSRNNSCTPSIESVAQIKFKKLPFYEVIDEIIKPTLLTGMDKCTLQDVPRDMKEATFKFNLSLEHTNLVVMNRDFSHGKNEFRNQFQIRICQLIEPVPKESSDYMPLGLHIRVGMKACPLPPLAPNTRPGTKSRRTARPINCTENIKLSPIIANNITINWTPDGKKYVFAMYLVKKLTVDTLIKKIQDKDGRSSEDTKNYIIKNLADFDPDLTTVTSYRFSLVCPLGKMRMKIPVKSIHCDHLQCFDASTFILMNEKKPTWMCPICDKPCLYDDIQIENYFLEVVSSSTLKDCSKEIEILADGTWRVFKETKNISRTHDKVKIIHCVDLDSDGEEPPTKRVKQENEAQAADAIQPVSVVDLKSQAQVQSQEAGTSSEQEVVIEID